jgi:predicted PurR-regulated permease PerM
LGGVVGMIIAVPFATILRITLIQISWTFKNYSVFRPPVNAS